MIINIYEVSSKKQWSFFIWFIWLVTKWMIRLDLIYFKQKLIFNFKVYGVAFIKYVRFWQLMLLAMIRKFGEFQFYLIRWKGLLNAVN